MWSMVFIIFNLFSYLLNPFVYLGYLSSNPQIIFLDMTWTLLFSIIICEVSIFIDYMLEKKFSWSINLGVKRLFIQGLLHIISSVAIVVVINFVFFGTNQNLESNDYREEITFLGQWIATSIIVSLLISAANTGKFLLDNWKRTALEAAHHKLKASEHKSAAMVAELQALKLQIDPHFIFNNLSVLSELILEDQQLGYEYAESFAKVYRYLLVNSKKDTISLDDELKFLNAYIYLIKKRIGDGVNFDISINDEMRQCLLPPMALQFLVENALKHNGTSKSKPLEIKVYTTKDQYLVVLNTLSPLVNKLTSADVGIKNIISRFTFLGDKKPIILKTEKDFIAKIPLYENK